MVKIIFDTVQRHSYKCKFATLRVGIKKVFNKGTNRQKKSVTQLAVKNRENKSRVYSPAQYLQVL